MSDQIEEWLRAGVSAIDETAKERARLRLRSAIEREAVEAGGRRGNQKWRWVAAAAVLSTLLLTIQILLPLGRGGPDAAVARLHELQSMNASGSSLAVGADGFLYRRYEERRFHRQLSVVNGVGFTTIEHVLVESWLAVDGSGAERVTYLEDVVPGSVVDDRAWRDAGAPDLLDAGEIRRTEHDPGGLSYFDVLGLPTETLALRSALLDGSVIERGSDDMMVLLTIGTLLGQQNASSDLRRALFEVATTIPSIDVAEGITDAVGRPATVVSVADQSGTVRLFFDPDDAKYLGQSESFALESDPHVQAEWRAYLEAGVVGAVGDRP